MKRILVLVAILGLVAAAGFAQTAADNHTVTINIAQIEAIDLESGANINFSTTAPVLAGDPVGPVVGAEQTGADRLFYTSLNAVGALRYITVQTNVAIPPGTTLTVTPTVAGGAGTSNGTVTFSNVGATAPTDLVIDIDSVATGRVNLVSGTGLLYTFWVSNASLLETGTTVVTVTYTLTDDIY